MNEVMYERIQRRARSGLLWAGLLVLGLGSVLVGLVVFIALVALSIHVLDVYL